MKVSVSVAAIMASVPCMAKADIRFYLNGVQIEATRKETRVIATDGHRLTVMRYAPPDGNALGKLEKVAFIVPRDDVLKMKATGTGKTHAIDIDVPDDLKGEFRATGPMGVVVFRAVEGVFPDYRRVIPKECDGKATQINGQYLADMQKSAKILLGSDSVHVDHSSTGACLVRATTPDFVGVIMGMRPWHEPVPSVEWVHT